MAADLREMPENQLVSEIRTDKPEFLLNKYDMHPNIQQCRIMDIPGHIEGIDLLLLAMQVNQEFGVPTIVAQNYISEKNEKELDDEILDFMQVHYVK